MSDSSNPRYGYCHPCDRLVRLGDGGLKCQHALDGDSLIEWQDDGQPPSDLTACEGSGKPPEIAPARVQ